MKKFFGLFLCIILLAACDKSSSDEVTPAILNPDFDAKLQEILDRDIPEVTVADVLEAENAYLIDTREYPEFEVSHLKNATWVGYDDFSLDRVANIPKDAYVISYCSIGFRSEKITQQLATAGYTDVANFYGGIFEWVNQGHPVYDMDGNLTDMVHAYDEEWSVWLDKGIKVY